MQHPSVRFMISTSSINVNPNLSSVQPTDNSSRRTQDPSYVKLPVPAIDFQQQIVRTAQPVDEVVIEATAETDLGTISADKSRVELRDSQRPLPKASLPVSQPPVAEPPAEFPSIDVSSEPNLGRSQSDGPTPLDVAKSLGSELDAGRTNSETADRLELSNEAKVVQVQARYSANSSVERLEAAHEENLERLDDQATKRSEQIVSEQDGQAGLQQFNHLV